MNNADCLHVVHSLPCLQVTDGAAAVLLMTRREALKRGLPLLGIFRSFAAVGVDPAIMGVGPAVAIPAAVEKVRSICVGSCVTCRYCEQPGAAHQIAG